MKPLHQYKFLKALRPFSLVVALISAGLGVVLGWSEENASIVLALVIITGALLSQAGINLINDIEDLGLLEAGKDESRIQQRLIRRNATLGVVCFLIASLIGGWLIWIRGIELFFIIVLSAALALNYNFGPLNFKHRGLAVVQVFILMGLALVQGAYLAMSGELSMQVVKLSLPISMLVSLLLLSNELRDWEADKANGVKTLSVRIGYRNAVRLYWIFIASAYAIALALYFVGDIEEAWWLVLPLPLLIPVARYLRASRRTALTPLTGRFFFAFGVAFILCL